MKDDHKANGGSNGEIRYKDLHRFQDELKAMARALLAREHNARSIQTTGLLLSALRRQHPQEQDWDQVRWRNQAYFFGAMRQAMIRVLIDHARARAGQRRQAMDHYVPIDGVDIDGPQAHEAALRCVPLDTAGLMALMDQQPEEMVALMESLKILGERHPDWADVVMLRNWGDYTVEEVARIKKISEATVKRHWKQAMALLADDIKSRLAKPGDSGS